MHYSIFWIWGEPGKVKLVLPLHLRFVNMLMLQSFQKVFSQNWGCVIAVLTSQSQYPDRAQVSNLPCTPSIPPPRHGFGQAVPPHHGSPAGTPSHAASPFPRLGTRLPCQQHSKTWAARGTRICLGKSSVEAVISQKEEAPVKLLSMNASRYLRLSQCKKCKKYMFRHVVWRGSTNGFTMQFWKSGSGKVLLPWYQYPFLLFFLI